MRIRILIRNTALTSTKYLLRTLTERDTYDLSKAQYCGSGSVHILINYYDSKLNMNLQS